MTSGNDEIILGASNGKAVRFPETAIRPTGRNASGVKVINLSDDNAYIVGVCTNHDGKEILVVTENGYGKRTPIEDYRMTSRGAKGVKTINVSDKNGQLVSLKAVNGDEDCLLMTSDGIVIRISLDTVSLQGRATQGVRLVKPAEGSIVSSVTVLNKPEEENEEE